MIDKKIHLRGIDRPVVTDRNYFIAKYENGEMTKQNLEWVLYHKILKSNKIFSDEMIMLNRCCPKCGGKDGKEITY